jgi:hypothetical protein
MSTTVNASEHAAAIEQGQHQLQALLQRSATDSDFRRTLLTDPRAALAEFSGREVPEGFNVVFVENKADATIVLPDFVDTAAELSDAELEAVAGGSEPVSTTIMTICVFLGSAAVSAAAVSVVAKIMAD